MSDLLNMLPEEAQDFGQERGIGVLRLDGIPRALGLVVWQSFDSPQTFTRELGRSIEALFLAEHCDGLLSEHHLFPNEITLIATVDLDETILRNFSFIRGSGDHSAHQRLLRAIRSASPEIDESKLKVWSSPVFAAVEAKDCAKRSLAGSEAYGEKAARLATALADAAQDQFDTKSPITMLEEIEKRWRSPEDGVNTIFPPAVFHAICDLITLLARVHYEQQVDWAVSSSDDGIMPPIFRYRPNDKTEWIHIPVGLHLVRHWMIARRPGELVPTMMEWMENQFGPDTSQQLNTPQR